MVFTADLRTLIGLYMGQISVAQAVADEGAALLHGNPEAAQRAWPILDIRP